MKKKFFFLTFGVFLIYCTAIGQKQIELHDTEKECIAVFENFMNYIKLDKMKSLNITSDSSLNYILRNFLYIDRKLDTTGNRLGKNIFEEGERKVFESNLQDFFRYFVEKTDTAFIDNMTIIPIRLSNDTFIYERMIKFQKTNTYVLYDKRNPGKTLFYILFVPPIKDFINEPRIWSWHLGYLAGKFAFTSPNGEQGYEHIFP